MALENGIPDFWIWLFGDPVTFRLFLPGTWGFLPGTAAICFLLLLLAPFCSFIVASFQYGPSEAFYYVARAMFSAVTEDLPRFSPRRTIAIARLAIQEAIRNRVLVGFGLFVILLLVAGLFLDVSNSNPARVYLSFVLHATNYLVLLMALFLSTFSIPNDIKNRTIYTVVTKPVRASEIVLGRILGFAAVGTAMVIGMGLLSYGFVLRGLSHDHQIEVESVVEEKSADGTVVRVTGSTTFDAHHRHTFELGADGKGRTNVVSNHWHDVERRADGSYSVSSPRGQLVAKAPVYGKLQIYDRTGKAADKGINVGNEWEYRGFIEGGTPGVQTKATAVWTFTGISEKDYAEGLPLEMTIRVFRSYKGDIERGVLGEIVLRNPNKDAPVKRSGPILFESKEFVADYRLIPRELNSESGGAGGAGKIDLFRDLVDNGRLEVEIRCVDAAQYFGMATPDLYLRPADATFEWNFFKAYLSIWLQMILVTCFGVTFSTFLTGSVAMMATLAAIVLGFFGEFVRGITTGEVYGGGPLESLIRMIIQQNVTGQLEMNSIAVAVVKSVDWVLMGLLTAGTYLLPNYNHFDTATFVADGYNIFGDLVAEQLAMAAVYSIAVAVVGYFFLKTREIAA